MPKTERHQQLTSRTLINTVTLLVTAAASFGIATAPPAIADTKCGPGRPPPGATSKDVSAAYGEPATLWISDTVVGIVTARGYGEAQIHSPSPLQRSALLIDAQQDGNHQIIVDTGREAILYAVSGCAISPVVDQRGEPFRFDLGHRRGNGDGIGCSDLGEGRRLVGLLQQHDDQHNPLLTVRRTEIDLNGAMATIGRSDTVTATSVQDPVWSTAGGISCGDMTMQRDGVRAPY
ncbi:hypothetical protein A5736_14775 [Mycobacterium sp. SP-6446]|nr:hypothetical protein A5736_14775 [Mycobacterium sp. SP-6446]